METIKLDCVYEERTSTKDKSKKYKAIFIKLSPEYEKVVFVSVPEQVLIEKENTTKVNDFGF